MKKKKRIYFEKLAEKYRGEGAAPDCAHFEKCGGCMFQDIPYENQLLLKKEYINRLMNERYSIEEVHGADPLGYRNRMDMVTAFGKFGLREAGSYRHVVDIESCSIMQKKCNSAYETIRPLVKEIEGYDYLVHQGFLRYVIFRQAMFTNQLMINFVLSRREKLPDEILNRANELADSVSLILSDGLADLSFGEVFENIKQGYIEEQFDSIKYRITPNSFFQSNSAVAVQMYRRIKEETEGRVLDLYSGVGSISLFVADRAEHVTGVEVVEEAVETANINRELNGISNVDFVCEDARVFVREKGGEYDTLILDPPRSGMHPKMLKHIREIAPPKIVYMSCNPATFREDLDGLDNYSLEKFEAFDMFPQTPHVESIAVLKKI